MNWLIDGILLAVLALTAFKHYRLGLSYTIYSIGRFIASVLAAALFGKLIGTFLADQAAKDGGMLSVILGYVVTFAGVYIALGFVIRGLRKIKIPLLSTVDQVLGLCLGLALGFFSVSLISTILYTVLEVMSAFQGNEEIMNIYQGSYIFRFVYNIRIFEFIRNLL